MIPSTLSCHKSSLYLNEHATLLTAPPASFFVHYWGGKPSHHGNTPHAHSFFEICYVADGEGTYIHNGITYPLRRSTIYCSKPGSQHYIHSESGLLLLFVAFEIVNRDSTPEVVSMFEKLSKFHHLFIPDAEQSAVVSIWNALISYTAEETVFYPEVVVELAHSLLLTSLAMFYKHGGFVSAETDSPSNPLSGTLKDAKDYIVTHLSERTTLKDVALALHLSERQLSRLLSEQLGQSFSTWVRNERVKRAAYMLVYTDLSMEEISKEVGFDTVHYFNRVFRAIMNITPGKFRKTAQGNEQEAVLLHRYLQTALNRNPDV